MTDEELAGWARNWHWNDTAVDSPVDPSIYFRDRRMLRAFVAALAEEKRRNCKHFNRHGNGSLSSDGASSYHWHCSECGASGGYDFPASVKNKYDQALTDVPNSSGVGKSES